MQEPRAVIRVALPSYISPKVQDKMFIDTCYEIAFGNGALRKKYTHAQVLEQLRKQVLLALKIQTTLNILTSRKQNHDKN